MEKIVSLIRQRLLSQSNKSEEEFFLRKIFAQFDTNKTGYISINELHSMCSSLGISVDKKNVHAILNVIDTNRNNVIEFEEFRVFILYNPYK